LKNKLLREEEVQEEGRGSRGRKKRKNFNLKKIKIEELCKKKKSLWKK